MKFMLKSALLGGAAWGMLAGFAMAQDKPADNTTVEEIVVTARRTSESVQKAPVAVSAFTARTLDRIGATSVTSLQGAVPNLNLVQGRGSSDATNIFIRGIGQPDALQTFDPAVGVYVDDVYYSRIRGSNLDLLDLERVEVLRGPQGTLYGKNTIAGALKLVTRKPDGAFRANVGLKYGTYNELEARASVSGDINDMFALGVSALIGKRDGYVTDPVRNQQYNDRDIRSVRLAAAVKPNDRLRLDLSADYTEQDPSMTVGRAESRLFRTDFALGVQTLQAAPAAGTEFNFRTRTTPGLPNQTPLSHKGVSATVTFEATDKLTIKSISAYRKLKYDDYIDIDATQFQLGDVFVGVDQDQTSQELQATYKGERLSAVGGLYYIKENITSDQIAFGNDIFSFLNGPIGFRRYITDDLTTKSWAAYANLTYAFSDRLHASVGLRYTDEKKDYFRTTTVDWTPPLALAALLVDSTFAFTKNVSFTDTSPMASIDYQVTDDALLYARVAKGFKSGGVNGRANNPGEQAPYAPETVLTYEAGAKTSWLDNRLRANFTVFYNDYKDFQARVSGTVPDPNNPANPPLIKLTVLNAGKLTQKGAELEVYFNPTPALLLDSQIGYLDAKYDEFKDLSAPYNPSHDRSWNTPAFSPEWTARFGASYEFDMASAGWLRFGGDANYRSTMALAVDNANPANRQRLPGMWQDSYWTFNARAVWESPSRKWQVGVYGRNLSDELFKTDAQEFSSVAGIRTAYYGAPRTWTLQVNAKF